MDDLVAFLSARLDEDERYARGALNDPRSDEGRALRIMDGKMAFMPSAMSDALTLHVVRHDPNRVLREVAAKRAIVQHYVDYTWLAADADPGQDGTRRTVRDTFYVAVVDLAAVYSDHPDYRDDWKP